MRPLLPPRPPPLPTPACPSCCLQTLMCILRHRVSGLYSPCCTVVQGGACAGCSTMGHPPARRQGLTPGWRVAAIACSPPCCCPPCRPLPPGFPFPRRRGSRAGALPGLLACHPMLAPLFCAYQTACCIFPGSVPSSPTATPPPLPARCHTAPLAWPNSIGDNAKQQCAPLNLPACPERGPKLWRGPAAGAGGDGNAPDNHKVRTAVLPACQPVRLRALLAAHPTSQLLQAPLLPAAVAAGCLYCFVVPAVPQALPLSVHLVQILR